MSNEPITTIFIYMFLPEITVKEISKLIIDTRIECTTYSSRAIPIYTEAYTSQITMAHLVTEVPIQQAPVSEEITRN